MGLIDKILGRNTKTEQVIKAGETFKLVSAYEPVFRDWRGEIYESLLVRAAIDARARHISKLKVEIIGDAKPDLMSRLRKRPNIWHTWSQELYRISTILDCCNNCIIVPIYDKDLNKNGVFAVLPSQCSIVTYKDEYYLKYKFLNDRATAACKLNECAILTKFQFKNDFFGSKNDCLDETLDLLHIQKQGIKQAVKSTAGYKFMAKLANFSKQSDLDKEREQFTESAFGPEAKKTGKPMQAIMPENHAVNIRKTSYIPESFAPDDFDKLEMYQKIDAIQNEQQLEAYKAEVKDQFGRLPKEVNMLFQKKELDLLINDPMVHGYREVRGRSELTFSTLYSQVADGVKLFEDINKISKDIEMKYTNQQIVVILPKKNDLELAIQVIHAAEKDVKNEN